MTNRAIREDADVPRELRRLSLPLLATGFKNGVSLPLMMNRWEAFESNLPTGLQLSNFPAEGVQ